MGRVCTSWNKNIIPVGALKEIQLIQHYVVLYHNKGGSWGSFNSIFHISQGAEGHNISQHKSLTDLGPHLEQQPTAEQMTWAEQLHLGHLLVHLTHLWAVQLVLMHLHLHWHANRHHLYRVPSDELSPGCKRCTWSCNADATANSSKPKRPGICSGEPAHMSQ